MCNLYFITTNQSAIAALFRVMNRYLGNLPPMPRVFSDYPASVAQRRRRSRACLMRWGMPPLPRTGGPLVTNIRNTLLAALARLVEAGKPLPGAVQQLR